MLFSQNPNTINEISEHLSCLLGILPGFKFVIPRYRQNRKMSPLQGSTLCGSSEGLPVRLQVFSSREFFNAVRSVIAAGRLADLWWSLYLKRTTFSWGPHSRCELNLMGSDGRRQLLQINILLYNSLMRALNSYSLHKCTSNWKLSCYKRLLIKRFYLCNTVYNNGFINLYWQTRQCCWTLEFWGDGARAWELNSFLSLYLYHKGGKDTLRGAPLYHLNYSSRSKGAHFN